MRGVGPANDVLPEICWTWEFYIQHPAFFLSSRRLSQPASEGTVAEPPPYFPSVALASSPSIRRVLISLPPVITLLYQSCQFSLLSRRSFFYFSRLFKFAPQPTAGLPIRTSPVKGGYSKVGGKQVGRGWLRLKGQGHCLELLPPSAIYLLFASRGAEGLGETNACNTSPLTKNDIPPTPQNLAQKRQPLNKRMALFRLVEHLLTSHLTSLPLMWQQLQYASSLHPPRMAESHI